MKIGWERHGSGPPLLLIHGLGYARWGWEPVVEPLARSFDVILFDNRGIGESDAPPGPYTTEELAQDAVQVLDEAGVERTHVVGTSLGGIVAQQLALDHPGRVDRLVLACTTPGGAQSFPPPQRTVDLMLARATLREYVENALEPDARPEIVDRILVHRERTAQGFEAWAAQAAAVGTFDVHERLGELAMPVLVQTGDGDVVVDPRNSELLAAAIPDAQLSIYAGAGHVFMWQDPDRFVAELEAFLC
ncbi:MAG: alpha/beta hydrolase [Gaiellaceae bacterium]